MSEKMRKFEHILPEVTFSERDVPQQQPVRTQAEEDPFVEFRKMQKQEELNLVGRMKHAQLVKAVTDAEVAAGLAPGRRVEQGNEQPSQDGQQPLEPQQDDGFRVPDSLMTDLPNMEPETRDAVINSLEKIARINAMSKDKGQLAMLGLMGTLSEKPQTKAPDVDRFTDNLVKMFQTGVSMSNQHQPPPPPPQSNLDAQLLSKILDKAFPTGEAKSPFKETVSIIKELKELGLISQPGPQGTDPNITLKLAEMDRDTRLQLARFNLDANESAAKLKLDEQKNEMWKDGIGTLLQGAGAAIGGGDLSALVQTGQTPGPPSMAAAQHTTQQVTCSYCNASFPIVDPMIGKQFPCPSCKKMLEFGPPSPSPPGPTMPPPPTP